MHEAPTMRGPRRPTPAIAGNCRRTGRQAGGDRQAVTGMTIIITIIIVAFAIFVIIALIVIIAIIAFIVIVVSTGLDSHYYCQHRYIYIYIRPRSRAEWVQYVAVIRMSSAVRFLFFASGIVHCSYSSLMCL